MQGASWISLFRRIPGNLHDGLALTLITGGEVVVQKFIKLDPDVVILRGRMAGTQDSGRVVIVPYCQLIAINFTRRLSEKNIEAIFGTNTQSFAADIVLDAPDPDPAEETGSAEEPAKEGATPNGAGQGANAGAKPAGAKPAGAKPALPSKAELLAKLRSRLGEGAK
jgi:hypothetical protein